MCSKSCLALCQIDNTVRVRITDIHAQCHIDFTVAVAQKPVAAQMAGNIGSSTKSSD